VSFGVQKHGLCYLTKGGGSREPSPFTSVDPLFYLSSFYPLQEKCCLIGGTFSFLLQIQDKILEFLYKKRIESLYKNAIIL
jgi:hypothetical protein